MPPLRKEKNRKLSNEGKDSIIRTNICVVPFPKGFVLMKFFRSLLLSLTDSRSGPMSPPVFFSCLPVLETENLVLRPPRRKDAKDIFSYASDPEVSRYVLWEPHRSLSETRGYVGAMIRRAREGFPSSWVITLRETGQVIGTIGFVWYSYDNRSAELGYSLSRKYWNRGYATQALGAVVGEAFRSLPVNRLEAQHDVRNPASGRVMEKCGLRQEGILRDRILNRNEYVDVALWAILRADWEQGQR